MAGWRHTIDLYDAWVEEDEKEGDADFRRIAKLIVEELKECPIRVPAILISCFEKADSLDEFNRQMENLLDWADQNKVWISTI